MKGFFKGIFRRFSDGNFRKFLMQCLENLLQDKVKKSSDILLIRTWRNISWMPPENDNSHSQNSQVTYSWTVSKSGPLRSIDFNDTPFTFAAVSQITRSFPDSFGIGTIPEGRYPIRHGSHSSMTSFVTTWTQPFDSQSDVVYCRRTQGLFANAFRKISINARTSFSCPRD